MTDSLPDPQSDVTLIKPLEQRLLLIRMRLGDAFSRLKLAHHASVVCAAASTQTSTDCDEEVAKVLSRVVTHHIDMEMRTLSVIIEELGGRTDFTEGSENLKDLYDRVNHEGKYATSGKATP